MDFQKELDHYIDVLTKLSQEIAGKTSICPSELQEMNKLIGRMDGVRNSISSQ